MKNYYLLFSIIITFLALTPLVLYVIPKQFTEVRRPKNEFTKLRKLVFLSEVFLALAMIPGLPRSFQLLSVPPVNNWAKVATISNKLPYLATMVILILIYNYRDKED